MRLFAFILTLLWTATSPAARVHVCTSTGVCSTFAVSGSCARICLVDGQTYTIAVTSMVNGVESEPSNELVIPGMSCQPVQGGCIVNAAAGVVTLQQSSNRETWSKVADLSGIQGPTFVAVSGMAASQFYRVEEVVSQ